MTRILAALALLAGLPAHAQDHFHPPQDAEIHDQFYSTWMRPDAPELSCCSQRDCYPTQARFDGLSWYARRREDGKWLLVPPQKIERNRDSPDGRNHLCALPPEYGDKVLCFVTGSGT